jgi:hypothetical protein
MTDTQASQRHTCQKHALAPSTATRGRKTPTVAPARSAAPTEPLRSKYGAVPVVVNGIRFASKREAARYETLVMLERAGQIRDLKLQTSWPLLVGSVKVATYRDDFSYIDVANGELVVEDSKGVRTPVYRLKRKLMAAIYGIEIREV